jgi:hydroxyethylthiazole kinase-like uncharacterized protein yjeF
MTCAPILTAAEMRAAEERVIAAGTSVETLMERAGAALADHVWRISSGAPILILCGPGNNGGDGYIAARLLQERGAKVRVAALREPRAPAAVNARRLCAVPIEDLATAQAAPIVVDALFGTGLERPLETDLVEILDRLLGQAQRSIAVDLPSGVGTDDGRLLGAPRDFDTTITFGALKPLHRLFPAAARCGHVVVANIGVDAQCRASGEHRIALTTPGPDDHKYSRGMVAVIGGAMPGASELAATAALRAGAGYALLLARTEQASGAHAVVRRDASVAADLAFLVEDKRITALLVGPGLGRDDDARERLDIALQFSGPLIIDGDALILLKQIGLDAVKHRQAPAVLTPHAGEFAALFGAPGGSKIDQAREAARISGCFVVFKGPDTILAAPDGRVLAGPAASPWLSTAGTGDVLAGAIAARCASGDEPFSAIDTGLWLHGEAARLAGPGLLACDVADRLSEALAIGVRASADRVHRRA